MAKDTSNGIREFVKNALKSYYDNFQVKLSDNASKDDVNPAIKLNNDGSVYIYDIGGYDGRNIQDASSLQSVIKNNKANISITPGANISTQKENDGLTISALGYKYNQEKYSFAELNNTATGFASHAEGMYADAIGSYSHAEGKGSIGSLGKVSNVSTVEKITKFTLKYISTSVDSQAFMLQVGDIVNYDSNYAKVTAIVFDSSNNTYTITTDKELDIKNGQYIYLVKGVSYGENAHTEGYLTAATENYAHAEGEKTSAFGTTSHAEGGLTMASGDYSHAEGKNTNASGYASHAEGCLTLASGGYSHAEGSYADAIGNYSHAEGYYTTASGMASHVEGYQTIAIGEQSHAEGRGLTEVFSYVLTVGTYSYELNNISSTISYQSYTLQVGDIVNCGSNYAKVTAINTSTKTITTDKDLGAEKNQSIYLTKGISYGANAHSEGGLTLATGDYSHAEGYQSKAIGIYSHSEGIKSSASGYASHAEGYNTTASGTASHVEGYQTIATSSYSHAECYKAKAYGYASHAEGENTTASGRASHAEGMYVDAVGDFSHVEGYQTYALGEHSHAEGKGTSDIFGYVSTIGSYTQYTLNGTTVSIDDKTYTLHVGDIINCGSKYAKITAINSNTKTITTDKEIDTKKDDPIYLVKGISYGANAHSEGGLTLATGDYSHAEGYITNAPGDYSHVEGFQTIASGDYSHAEGYWPTASGTASHAEGGYAEAFGRYSHAEGYYTTATATASHVEGYQTYASGTASHAEGKGTTSALGTVRGVVSTEWTNNLYELSTLSATISGQSYTLQVGDTVNYGSNYAKVTAINSETKTITTDKDLGAKANDTINFVIGGSYGDSAHSEGYLTVATGSYSHAEGYQTTASGTASHAEGYLSFASGTHSHAEGYQTAAYGKNSHAEGNGTMAGKDSHAEGQATHAAYISHTEGVDTFASIISHAEGQVTFANSEKCSHTEGGNIYAEGNYSHAEGKGDLINAITDNTNLNVNYFEIDRENLNINIVTKDNSDIVTISPCDPPANVTSDIINNALSKTKIFYFGGWNTYVLPINSATYDNGTFNITVTEYFKVSKSALQTVITNTKHEDNKLTLCYFSSYTNGEASHIEGISSKATNPGEHAEGKYNQSHEGQTIHSIGIGTSNTNRKNAFEISQNGDIYIYGLGNYNGTLTKNDDPGIMTLYDILKALADATGVDIGAMF